jgi:hypothetical protein
MAITVRDLQAFLATCPPDDLVAIDAGAVALEVAAPDSHVVLCLGIGGWHDDDTDGEDR